MNKFLSIKSIYICCLIVLMTLMSGCGGDDDLHNHPDLVTGQQLFDYHCASCHQTTGTGSFLKGIPGTKDTELSVDQIRHKIAKSEGGKVAMPAFPNMPEEEALKIANYIKQMR
jgi:mono/diheme cytochrome c family protein